MYAIPAPVTKYVRPAAVACYAAPGPLHFAAPALHAVPTMTVTRIALSRVGTPIILQQPQVGSGATMQHTAPIHSEGPTSHVCASKHDDSGESVHESRRPAFQMSHNSPMFATKLLCSTVKSTNLSSASGKLRCASFCRGIRFSSSCSACRTSSCVKSFAPTPAVCRHAGDCSRGRSSPKDGVHFSSASTELRCASAFSVCRPSSGGGLPLQRQH